MYAHEYWVCHLADGCAVQWGIVCDILQNRKNDEVSYEKMLKLKKDLNKALYVCFLSE